MNSLTIVVPLPDPALNPNARVHWARKMKATKRARFIGRDAVLFTLSENLDKPGPQWPAASIRLAFYVKDKRGLKQDKDNAIASCKAYADGIADAGVVVNDRVLTWEAVEHRIDRNNPRVEITITRTGAV